MLLRPMMLGRINAAQVVGAGLGRSTGVGFASLLLAATAKNKSQRNPVARFEKFFIALLGKSWGRNLEEPKCALGSSLSPADQSRI